MKRLAFFKTLILTPLLPLVAAFKQPVNPLQTRTYPRGVPVPSTKWGHIPFQRDDGLIDNFQLITPRYPHESIDKRGRGYLTTSDNSYPKLIDDVYIDIEPSTQRFRVQWREI